MYGDVLDRYLDRKPSKPKNGKTAGSQDSEPSKIKATFHLSMEDILAIDKMQMLFFTRTRKKPERSQIVSQALQIMAKQHGVKADAL